NLTFGFLWDVYEKQENLLTLGLVYHTTFTAKVDWELVRHVDSEPPDPPRVRSMDIDFPASLGAGVNYRFSDSLSAAFDVEWKEWSKYTQTFVNGRATSPFNYDTLAYRLGGEYLFLEGARESVLACRGGAFYEPRPTWNDILPVYGFSTGLGWTLREQFSLDFAYQYRWGEQDLEEFDYKIKEDFFVVSLIRYF
ncbi:MAG: OmpP1/FadL family transporter, partial [Planctomycetota bacterium]